MLRWRLLLGVLLVAGLAGLCWLDAHASRPGIYLAPLGLVVAALAAGELLQMFRSGGRQPAAQAVYLGSIAPVLASCAPLAWQTYPGDCPIDRIGWLALGLAAGTLIVFVAEMRRYNDLGLSTVNVALGALAVLYIGGSMGMLVQLRLIEDRGLEALAAMIIIVKSSDIGQYAAGRLLGRHKLAARLSPGKTWEGVVGGVAFAIVSSLLVARSLGNSFWSASVCAVALSAAGITGDLAESLLKRDSGVKDSSSWLPGFGGVLDLVDSLLLAAPVAYVCWVAGWMG